MSTPQEVSTIQNETETTEPKHGKKESSKPRHKKAESKKPKILKVIIVAELILVILACYSIYRTWCHIVDVRNIEARHLDQFCSAALANASETLDGQTKNSLKTYMESIAEEVYEYVWATEKVKYRTGADMSYKAAGTLEKEEYVRRTGITHNGWSRITIDEEDYYVPAGILSTDTPDWLPIASGAKGEYQKYALSLLPDFGWPPSELEPLIYLWNKESGWNPNSHNKRSGAHGIPQALPGSKMASEGSDYYTNAEPQIRWGLKYIARRYGSPSNAWAHWCSKGWY